MYLAKKIPFQSSTKTRFSFCESNAYLSLARWARAQASHLLPKSLTNYKTNIQQTLNTVLSKVASCRRKSPPIWLVSAGYSARHFFTDFFK